MTVIKPWITEKLIDLLGFEDDVLIELVFSLMEEKVFEFQVSVD